MYAIYIYIYIFIQSYKFKLSLSNNYSLCYYFVIHDYITVSPAQYYVHLNSCVIRSLAGSLTFNAPPKRPAHSGKTITLNYLLCLTSLPSKAFSKELGKEMSPSPSSTTSSMTRVRGRMYCSSGTKKKNGLLSFKAHSISAQLARLERFNANRTGWCVLQKKKTLV